MIPCYNCRTTISKCIDSVLEQSVKPYEIILVNDGSTDDSNVIATRYDEVTVIDQVRNQGLSVARNAGIENSKGDIIAFFDSDVQLPTNYLEIMLADFVQFNDVVGVGGQETPAFLETHLDRFRAKYLRQSKGDESIHGAPSLNGLAMAFRRDIFTKVGLFMPDFKTNGEDVFISALIRKAGYLLYYDHRLTVKHWKKANNLDEIRRLVYRNAYFGTKALMLNGYFQDTKSKLLLIAYEIRRSLNLWYKVDFPLIRLLTKGSQLYAILNALFDQKLRGRN